MADKINFAGLADAALDNAESLLASWLPQGHRDGHEWKSVNPTRSDRSEGSFSVSITKGRWGDFATDDKGKDLVSLCAYLFHNNDQVAAAYDVAGAIGYPMPTRPTARRDRVQHQTERNTEEAAGDQAAPAAKAKREKTPWVPILPVPEDAAPIPVAHQVRGRPERTWEYRAADGQLLGIVWRFVTSDGGKDVIPLTWCRNEKTGKFDWRGVSFPMPRPLYGLDRLAANPEATVIITEGEKCADVAHEQLPDLASVSWPGGGKAVDKVDWSPLGGRKIILWPDCDAQLDKDTHEILPEAKQPGWKAMLRIAERLQDLGCTVWRVRIPKPGEVAGGWDIADAVDDGIVGAELADWMRDRLLKCPDKAAAEPVATPQKIAPASAGAEEYGEPPDDDWERRLLTDKNGFVRCVMNVHDIMLHTPQWKDAIAFDEFAQRTVKLQPPPYFGGGVGEWDSVDDTQAAMWVARTWSFAPGTPTVAEAVETLARANTVHPVRDWLRSLPEWDGISRVEQWLSDYCGVLDSVYVRLVSRFFLIGMIARVMKPGVKFDYCLVLEGPQGKGKSTIARILGGDWYGDTDLDLSNKDSMAALRGKWVYEFAEMGSVARAESLRQKSFLSRQFDEFRPVYGRREIRLARQVVFIGTTNDWEWNKDPTGGRRFWPVNCEGEFNIKALRDVRDQLFAEALAIYDRGVELFGEPERFEEGYRFWPSAAEQKELFDIEQLSREQQDGVVDWIHDWVYEQVAPFSMADIAQAMKLDMSKLTRDLQTRIGNSLRKLGCRKIEKRNGMTRYWYEPPVRKEASSNSANAEHRVGGRNVGF